MHSGGGLKEKWARIYIEAPEEEAKIIFYNRFGHNPERVTCTCCGEDYSVHEYESLEQATAFHRNCAYGTKEKKWVEKPDNKYGRKKLITLEKYLQQKDVLAVYAKDIKPEERHGDIPRQGYVWMDWHET